MNGCQIISSQFFHPRLRQAGNIGQLYFQVRHSSHIHWISRQIRRVRFSEMDSCQPCFMLVFFHEFQRFIRDQVCHKTRFFRLFAIFFEDWILWHSPTTPESVKLVKSTSTGMKLRLKPKVPLASKRRCISIGFQEFRPDKMRRRQTGQWLRSWIQPIRNMHLSGIKARHQASPGRRTNGRGRKRILKHGAFASQFVQIRSARIGSSIGPNRPPGLIVRIDKEHVGTIWSRLLADFREI